MRYLSIILLAITTITCLAAFNTASLGSGEEKQKLFSVHPIGYVKKTGGKTAVVLNKKYQPGLLGMEKQDEIWVLWWFDRNDTPEKRSILQVHPRGNSDNPLTGVFSTRAPFRPNLIALTKCKVIAVKDNVIEIESIDALPDTPVLDIKRVIGGSD